MNIDWNALAQVFGVSLVTTVGLVGVFTLGIVATARKPQPQGSPAMNGAGGGTAAGGERRPLPIRAAGYLCFALCAAAVAYGIYLIVA